VRTHGSTSYEPGRCDLCEGPQKAPRPNPIGVPSQRASSVARATRRRIRWGADP